MELLITTIASILPQVYIIGVVGVAFQIFVKMYLELSYPNIQEITILLIYPLLCGALWPGLLIAKITL